MLDTLSYRELAAQVNTKFLLTEMSEPSEIELIEVTEPRVTSAQEAFALVFLGPKDFPLPQKIYELAHEALGTGALFLVPIGQSVEGFKYEAVFNRLIESAS